MAAIACSRLESRWPRAARSMGIGLMVPGSWGEREMEREVVIRSQVDLGFYSVAILHIRSVW